MLNRQFEEKLVGKAALKLVSTLFFPAPLRIARVLWHALPFLRKGLRCLKQGKIKVELLDAVSIGLSMIRRDFATAGSVMFLLELGELLEEWTQEEIGAGSGAVYVLKCGQGMAEHAGRRSPDARYLKSGRETGSQSASAASSRWTAW